MREANEDDIPKLLEMGRAFYERSPYKALGPYDEQAVTNVLRFMNNSKDALILLNDEGAIGGLMVPLFYSPAVRMMEVQFNWFSKGGKAAICEFEKLARIMGAKVQHLSRFHDGRQASGDRLLGSLGYYPTERRYVKGLN